MTTLPSAPQWYTTRPGALQPAELLTSRVGKCVRRRERNSPCTYLYLGYIFCSWDINKANCREVKKVLGQEAYLVSSTVPSGHSPAGYPELEIPPHSSNTFPGYYSCYVSDVAGTSCWVGPLWLTQLPSMPIIILLD